ncbi:MAG: hypothetical protein JW863_09890 [Chitinispirillaceae bacterium]|nr:hypothetical protein [Chitinispirillaceae bacterium]
MSEDRKRILSMVAEGKITVEEAEKLLGALGAGNNETAVATGTVQAAGGKSELKYLRVVVDSTGGDNVNVRVPMALLRAGLKLSALVPPQVYQKVSDNMAEKGMDFDLNTMLKSGDIEQLMESLGELNVDVNAKNGDKVRVFFE